ncbi:MAG TPA: pyridoxamine 5'-phosphate oxidase family protein [Gaiellaceae bacterium]|jgi:hypothetical protein|nr:pyridoxamine 5'-phosphate oxidase family protein [Gaiellaceae bacterium]
MSEPRTSRASFPGYGISEDAAGLLPWSWAEERLAASHSYWIVTASLERGPHAMPVWGLWRVGGLVFSSGASSRKARNLAADPRVVVHLESGDEVVVVEGNAEIVEPTAELLDEYAAKYQPVAAEIGRWYFVRPRRVYAFRERDYPQSATRFDW